MTAAETVSSKVRHVSDEVGEARDGEQLMFAGTDQAEQNRDIWWWEGANLALEQEAASGREFTAFDLSERYPLAPPDHPNRWGALFRAAARRGVIEQVRVEPSRRPTTAGGLCRVWRGAS